MSTATLINHFALLQPKYRHYFTFVNKSYLTCLFFLFLTIASFAQKKPDPPPSPGTGGTVGGFEVDAHFASGSLPAFWTPNLTSYSSPYTPSYTPNITTYGKDWSGANGVLLKNGSGVFIPGTSADLRSRWQVDGNWGNKSPAPEGISFAGSSNKNSDLIGTGEGQAPYFLQLGGTGPQKNDITNTYLHSREEGTDTWLFFGAETRATNGSSYLDFEYNQAGVQTSNLRLIGNGPNGGRTPGDFILVVNYVEGGSVPLIGVRIWQANNTWSEELLASQITAFITINTTDVPAVAANAAYKDDGSATSTTKALQFVEGGINISDLTDLAPLNLCNPEATVTVKTRSSASFTAELKDLDVVPFSIIPGPDGDNVPFSLCSDAIGGTTATFDLTSKASAVTKGASGVSVVGWFETYNSATGVFSNEITTPGAYSSGSKTVYAKLTNINGCLGKGEVALTVNSSPAGTNTTQTLCSDAIGGTTATFDLTLKNSTVTGGVNGVTVVGWFETFTIATGVFSNPINTPDAYSSGSKTVYAKLSGQGNCIGVAENALTVNTSPVGTNTSQTLCPDEIGGSTATFNLTSKNSTVTGGVNGVTVVGWFETFANATGVFSNEINTPAAYTSGSKTVYAKLSGQGSCIGVAENVLTVNLSPTGTNTTQTLCPDDIGGTTATFDLTSKNSIVTGGVNGVSVVAWFETYNSTTDVFSNEINTPAAYSSGSKTVYAKLSNANNCIGVASNILTVNTSPSGTNTTQTLCPDAIGGTTATFDLTSKNSIVTGGVNAVSVVAWFETYNSTTDVFSNEINTPGAYSSVSKTVYAKLSNANNCISVANNVLTVNTSPSGTNTSQTLCPTNAGGTTAIFNLTLKNSTVTGGVNGVTVVGWFETFTIATGVFSNPINTPDAYSSGSKTVYAKLSGQGNCIGVAENALTVLSSPPKPAVVYNHPACDENTFSVTVGASGNPVIAGAKYTIVNKDGGAIAGVSPASPYTAVAADVANGFSFSNIPAGSGFKVSVESAAGCSSDPEPCGTPTQIVGGTSNSDLTPVNETQQVEKTLEIDARIESQTKVLAAPNPFNDRVRFNLVSGVSGMGSLEVFNVMGQKVAVVYQGYIQAGRTITQEYNVPETNRKTLIYVFKVGDQQVTGKLIGLKQ